MSDRGVQIALSEGLEVLSAAWTDGSLGKYLATAGERSTDSLRLSNASDIFRVRHFLDRTDRAPGVFRAGLLAFQFFFPNCLVCDSLSAARANDRRTLYGVRSLSGV